MKRIHYIIIAVVAVIFFSAYVYILKNGGDEANVNYDDLFFPQLTSEVLEGEKLVTIDTTLGEIKIKLFAEHAPKTVENFVQLSERGYYDGVIFHRVIEDFMIQSGDPLGTGAGGESIYDGYFEDEISNELYNIRGALSMANLGRKNTNTSQFFIVQRSEMSEEQVNDLRKHKYPEEIINAYKEYGGTPWLDKLHTVFGQVIEGMDVVDKIASVEVDGKDKPLEEVRINKITVHQ